MQAKAYALMGDKRAYAAICHAESSAGRIRLEDEPAETNYVQQGLIQTQIAEALTDLGDFIPARQYSEELLRADVHARGRVNRLASMATLELDSGNFDSASAFVADMVNSAQGMESRRLYNRFRKLRVKLNNHPAKSTSDAVDRIDRALKIVPW